ncbi:uncharacterized protein LOC132716231 [Ruditapes philippinarum]|uniref:uncharacterized protein LOC132716231 n=1 Tax=Ruditapes philippinarum TaxID=129788 RepID=UPI00295C0DE7|nr:uncharacterized protein LOC132716231 [Ruditapes philippinarum]
MTKSDVVPLVLLLSIYKGVSGFSYLSKDGVEITYSTTFKRECRGDMDILITFESISLAECVMACGMRQHCKALNYIKVFNKCNLYFSDETESDRVKRSCVEIKAADINVIKKPCPECDADETCIPANKRCETTECVNFDRLDNGFVNGNLWGVNDNVQYVCNDGKTTVHGIKCLPDGLWNISSDICTPTVTNVALGKPTNMSSYEFDFDGWKGVDGDTNQRWSGNSCFHTDSDHKSWWRVDLGKVFRIVRVVLYNRVDCCASRASNLDLLFGTTEDNMDIVRQVDGQIGDTHTFNFTESEEARFVQVMLRYSGNLHLCEVQVFGFVTFGEGKFYHDEPFGDLSKIA